MKRNVLALFATLLIISMLSSCTYQIMDSPVEEYEEIIYPESDFIYKESNIKNVLVPNQVPAEDITAIMTLEAFPNFFTHFLTDGFFNEVLKQMELTLPELSIRPRSVQVGLDIDAYNEVLSLGTEYLNISKVNLERLKIHADGNTSNLTAFILHYVDPVEWPLNVPISGNFEICIKADIGNGSDAEALEIDQPKAELTARISMSLEHVVFKTITVNNMTIPYPVQGNMAIKTFDASLAASHMTIKVDPELDFPPLDGTEDVYETIYAPFSISLYIEPTRKFKTENIYWAIQNMIKDNESISAYWSYIVNNCWTEYAGDHIAVTSKLGQQDGNIKETYSISNLLIFEAMFFGI